MSSEVGFFHARIDYRFKFCVNRGSTAQPGSSLDLAPQTLPNHASTTGFLSTPQLGPVDLVTMLGMFELDSTLLPMVCLCIAHGCRCLLRMSVIYGRVCF